MFGVLRTLLRPALRAFSAGGDWFREVIAAQIEHYRPDVLVNLAMDGVSPALLSDLKGHYGLLVGQHAASYLPPAEDYRCYDLVLSSFPPTVERIRQNGIRAELFRLGFEPRLLAELGSSSRRFDVTFAGSFQRVHSSRITWLEAICDAFPQAKVWAPALDLVSRTSPIRACYAGPAWGREMLKILSESRITLNQHGDIAPYANNMRLYEATGMGALLVTDWKENLQDMFVAGQEVAAYRSVGQCLELIQHFLAHEADRQSMAAQGQRRTLQTHTYLARMQELIALVSGYA